MPKITLSNLSSLANQTAAINTLNNNFAALAAQIDLLMSRDAESPNSVLAEIDMNSNRIRNLPNSVNTDEPFTHGQALAHLPNITAVSQGIAYVNAVGADLLGAQTIITVANDLDGANTIGAVSSNIALVNAVGTNVVALANLNTYMTELLAVNTNTAIIYVVGNAIANVNTVAGAIASVQTVAGNIVSVQTVASNIASIQVVTTNIGALVNLNNQLGNPTSDLAVVAGDLGTNNYIGAVGAAIADVGDVANSLADVTILADNIADVVAVGDDLALGGGSSFILRAPQAAADALSYYNLVNDYATTAEDVPVPSEAPWVFNPTTAVDTGTDKITKAAHSYLNGQLVLYTHGGGTSIGGLTSGTLYYIVNKATNDFQLAATKGGAAINLTSVGSGSVHTLADIFSLVHYAAKARAAADDASAYEAGAAELVASIQEFVLGSYANAAAAWANPNATANQSIYFNSTSSDWRVLGAASPQENILAQFNASYDAILTALNGGALPSGVIASQVQAEAGVENTKGMTPLRVAQAIAALSPSETIASQGEAQAGSDNTKMMTPLRTFEAIDALQFLSFIDPASPEYGAVAGTGSDQKAILQQAIDDAIANNKALYLGQEYRVDSGLTIAGTAGSEVAFRMFGPGGLLVNHTGVVITIGSTTGAITRDYQFSDIVIRRQTASVPVARPILLNNVSDVHFEGVKVLGFNGFAQIGRTGTADDAIRIFFDRCRFQQINGDDATLSGFLLGGSAIVNFTDCFFNGTAATGQTVGAMELIDQTTSTVNCDGFVMQGCTAEQWAKAFKCDGDAGISNLRVSDNIFDRFGTFAIQLQNVTAATKRISIANNVFQGVEGDSERGVFISQASLSLGSEVTITGNHFFDMEEEGVWLNNLYSVNVDDNTFLNCGRNSANEILIANCNTVSLGDNPIRAGTGSGLGVAITGSAGISVPNFISNDSGAASGPNLTLRRLSGSPAASDIGGEVQFNFNNSTPAEITGAKLSPVISDATAASEDINLEFHTRVAGTLASRMKLGNGLMLGTASDPGAGGLGASGPIIGYGGGQFWSTDAGAGDGPDVYLIRDSASPAASDKGGRFIFSFRNSSASIFTGCTLETRLIDATAGSMDTALDFGTVVAGSFDTRLKVAQGVVVGNPTGGDKGVGTLNATGVYDDNTLLTDLVLDLAVYGSFDAEKYANHPVAPDLSADWFNADWYADYWRRERRLPGMISWDRPEDQPSTGELVTRLTAVVEAQAVLIENLNKRIKALESMVAE